MPNLIIHNVVLPFNLIIHNVVLILLNLIIHIRFHNVVLILPYLIIGNVVVDVVVVVILCLKQYDKVTLAKSLGSDKDLFIV